MALLGLSISGAIQAGSLVNHSGNALSQLSSYQLSDIFTLKRKNWPNGLRIQIILLREDPPDYVSFITSQLGIFPYQLKRHWKRINFAGQGQPPIFVDSVSQLLSQLANTPGAIAYVPGDITAYDLAKTLDKELQRVEIIP